MYEVESSILGNCKLLLFLSEKRLQNKFVLSNYSNTLPNMTSRSYVASDWVCS
jgi:hypothetical protein